MSSLTMQNPESASARWQRPLRLAAALLSMMGAVLTTACAPLSSPTGLAPAFAPESREEVVKLQIFLDGQRFRPGVIDGRSGEFTRKALVLFREANGLPYDWQPNLAEITPYRSYTVSQKDLSVFGPMASEPEEMARLKRLPYEHLLELLAERFHTTQEFIEILNPGVNVNALPAGAQVIVPNIRAPFDIHGYPSAYPALASGAKNRHVEVDIHFRMLQVKEGGRVIAAFPATPGSQQFPAPAGEWKIMRVVPNPWFRWDEGVLKRGERTKTFYNLPPGPNSPVGILWAGLNRPGIGIHGSPNPDLIGRSGSHGCIRLANWDAATFRTLVNSGTTVSIR